MRTITGAALLLALTITGCGSNTPTATTTAAPSTVTVTPPPTVAVSPTPGSVEQAEIDYNIALCSAALQVYVGVQENTLPNYSRAQYLRLDGCVDLTEPQYEVAVDKWAELG